MSSDSAIPVEAVLKLVIDRAGSSAVEDALKKQENSFSAVEGTVSRISTHMEGVVRSVGELAGIAGVGALVDKFIKLETSASNVALAMGKVTGGSGTYSGIRQELLGVQSKTGVSAAESAATLQALSQSVGLNPSAKQAGMLAAVIAGFSNVTGISSATVGSLLGPMLQAEGRSSSPGAAAFTLGEARANLTAFPGSQLEGMLPVVSGLATSAALGTAGGAGKGVAVGGISALINTISGPGSVLRNPEIAAQAAQGIGGTLQGAYANPRVYSFMKMAGIDFKEQQLGFNSPKVQEKLVGEAMRQYPGNSEAAWKERRLLYLELGQGEAGADALERIEGATKGGGIHVATPKMKKEASEAHNAQKLSTPEAKLKKVEGGSQSWLFSSSLHEAAGAAGLLYGPKLLGKLNGLLGGGAEGAEGAGATLGDLAGGAVTGAVLPTIMSLIDPGGSGDIIGRALNKIDGSGSLAGNATGNSRKAIEARANAKAVGGVAAAAQKKFGASWKSAQGVKWMEHELNNTHSRFDQETSVGIGESQTSMHPWAATHLLQQALGAGGASNPSATGGEGQQFSEAVKKFSEAVAKLTGTHSASYGGGAAMHSAAFMGAPAVAAMQASVPGVVMAAFLGKGNTTGGATPSSSGPGTMPASFNPCSASSSVWNSVLSKYSGGSYGLSHVNQLAGENKGGGAHPGDRATVEADAKKYGVPFNVLWGIYGAESSFGKAASNFGLTGQFPGTGTSGNFNTDARMSAQDLANLVKQMNFHVHVNVGGSKVEQHRTKIGRGQAV